MPEGEVLVRSMAEKDMAEEDMAEDDEEAGATGRSG